MLILWSCFGSLCAQKRKFLPSTVQASSRSGLAGNDFFVFFLPFFLSMALFGMSPLSCFYDEGKAINRQWHKGRRQIIAGGRMFPLEAPKSLRQTVDPGFKKMKILQVSRYLWLWWCIDMSVINASCSNKNFQTISWLKFSLNFIAELASKLVKWIFRTIAAFSTHGTLTQCRQFVWHVSGNSSHRLRDFHDHLARLSGSLDSYSR